MPDRLTNNWHGKADLQRNNVRRNVHGIDTSGEKMFDFDASSDFGAQSSKSEIVCLE